MRCLAFLTSFIYAKIDKRELWKCPKRKQKRENVRKISRRIVEEGEESVLNFCVI